MFEISGTGTFIGDVDVALGITMANTLRNEGFIVNISETHNLAEEDGVINPRVYVVKFSSKNNIF